MAYSEGVSLQIINAANAANSATPLMDPRQIHSSSTEQRQTVNQAAQHHFSLRDIAQGPEAAKAVDRYGTFSLILYTGLSVASLMISVMPLINGDNTHKNRARAFVVGGCACAVWINEFVHYLFRHKRLVPNTSYHPEMCLAISDMGIGLASIGVGTFNVPLLIATGTMLAARVCVTYTKVISACIRIQSCLKTYCCTRL